MRFSIGATFRELDPLSPLPALPVSEPRFLFPRAALAFAVLPGMIGYAVPLTLARGMMPAGAWRWPGLALVALGSILLLSCVRDFYVAGRGTLAPWTPPTRLVTVGLYRFSRNPMYLAVLTVLAGWALLFRSSTLLTYGIVVAVAFHLRVLLYEEPRLLASFGDDWLAFRRRVRRWL